MLCVVVIQTSQICSEMANFIFSAYFGGHFVTIATVKVKVIWDFYTLVIVLINKIRTNLWKTFFLYFSLIGGGGGQKKPLMHVAQILE